MSKDNQESTNNKNTQIHLILEKRLNGLEETIKLIKEKMIKPNSDSIEELEQKLGDWEFTDEAQEVLGRIEAQEKKLPSITDDIDVLKRRIRSQSFPFKLMNKLKKEIAKLGDKLQKCGVKWDFRLDELNGFITELKEHLNRNEGMINDIRHYERKNRDTLRELSQYTYNMCVAIMTNMPLEKLTIKESLWKLIEKLDGEKSDVDKKDGQYQGTDGEYRNWGSGWQWVKKDGEKAQRGWEHFGSEKAIKESLQPHKEYAGSARQTENGFCIGTIEDALSDFWEVYDLETENGRLSLAQEIDKCIRMFCFEDEILVEREDLDKLCFEDRIWMKEKYLSKEDSKNEGETAKERNKRYRGDSKEGRQK